tara:strand:- start:453 stop:599 length:147 start_codon:yes stop_codon:yes gene_type:complete
MRIISMKNIAKIIDPITSPELKEIFLRLFLIILVEKYLNILKIKLYRI